MIVASNNLLGLTTTWEFSCEVLWVYIRTQQGTLGQADKNEHPHRTGDNDEEYDSFRRGA